MPSAAAKHAVKEVVPPAALSSLQVQLAEQAVIDEMAIPGGLKHDAPVSDDPIEQYKAQLRSALAPYPQDLDTQFAAKEAMDEAHVVPPAETTDAPPVDPEAGEPELVSLEPDNYTIGVDEGLKPVLLHGGPFDAYCQIVWNGGVEKTDFVNENTLGTSVNMSTVTTEGAVPVLVRRGEHETSSLDFTFNPAPPPPEPPPPGEGGNALPPLSPGEPTQQGGTAASPVVEGA